MLTLQEVARSLELYNLGIHLQEQAKIGNTILEFTREPFLRDRRDLGRIVVAFGSYDPLSRAHEALFRQGLIAVRSKASTRGQNSLEELVIVTSTHHFDKKLDLHKNSTIYDRIHAQESFASCVGNVSLAFFNNPYFVNLAPAIQKKYGNDADIYFVVGADVMEKIVDRKEYEKRGFDVEQILRILFQHTFLVSERKVTYKDQAPRLLNRDNLVKEYELLEQYASRILPLSLDASPSLEIPIQEVSSTLIRERRSRHEPVENLEAVGISDFVDKRSLYIKDNLKYEAFVCARQLFADHFRGQPIGNYLHRLMKVVKQLDSDAFQRKVIDCYSAYTAAREILNL